MAKNDQEEMLEKVLSAHLSRVIEWTKFAEAKNAAAVTFSSAWILGILSLLIGKNPIPVVMKIGVSIALPLFLGSVILSLSSFIPRVDRKFFSRTLSAEINPLFYGDVTRVKLSAVAEVLKSRYLPAPERSVTDQLVSDLADQIWINSSIASRKYSLFNASVALIIGAIICLSVPLVLTAISIL